MFFINRLSQSIHVSFMIMSTPKETKDERPESDFTTIEGAFGRKSV